MDEKLVLNKEKLVTIFLEPKMLPLFTFVQSEINAHILPLKLYDGHSNSVGAWAARQVT